MSRRSAVILLVIVILVIGVGIGLRDKKPTPQQPAKTGLVGQQAPDFQLPLVGGGDIRLSDLRGQIVLVNFWATWCPPCKAEMPSMERLYSRFKNNGLELLAVNAEVDGLEVLPEFLQKHKHTFPVPVDTEGEAQATYGVFRFPESFIIGRDGVILEHIIGGRDWSDRQTIEHFADLTQGK